MSKVVLITGAGSGIGKATCELLLKNAYKIICIDKNTDTLQAIYIENKDVFIKQVNIKDDILLSESIKESINHFGSIDIWINNAGIMPKAHFEKMNLDDIRNIMEVNFLGTVKVMQWAINYFLGQNKKGHIINIASITGKVPLPYSTVYSASKAAIANLCNGLRSEYDHQDIKITCVLPGSVNTPLIKDMKAPIFPPVISPVKVASKILQLIKKPKNNVYIPWYLGPMGILQDILPHKVLMYIGDKIKITESAKPKS